MFTISHPSRFWHWAFLFLLALPGRAAIPGPIPLDGIWQGQLTMPGRQLEMVLKLAQLTSGDYVGTLDIPLAQPLHLAVTAQVRADSVWVTAAAASSRFQARITPDGRQLEGTWQQPGGQVPLTLARRLAVGATNVPPPTYHEEAVSFGTDNVRLAGTFTAPTGAGPFAAVVLLTDRGALNRDGLTDGFAPLALLADYLTRQGLAVLRFDARGTGSSTGNAQATMAERVADARTALNFLRARPEVNLAQLGLIGHGEGSSVALLAAAQPLPPAFVVGLAPYGLTGAEVALHQQQALLTRLGVPANQVAANLTWQRKAQEIVRQTPGNPQAQAMLVTVLKQSDEHLDDTQAQLRAAEMLSPAYRDFLAFNPTSVLPRLKGPILLLGGTADQTLQTDANLQALNRGLRENLDVTVRRLPGMNHLLQPDPAQWPIVSGQPRPVLSPALEDDLQSWLTTQLAKLKQ